MISLTKGERFQVGLINSVDFSQPVDPPITIILYAAHAAVVRQAPSLENNANMFDVGAFSERIIPIVIICKPVFCQLY